MLIFGSILVAVVIRALARPIRAGTAISQRLALLASGFGIAAFRLPFRCANQRRPRSACRKRRFSCSASVVCALSATFSAFSRSSCARAISKDAELIDALKSAKTKSRGCCVASFGKHEGSISGGELPTARPLTITIHLGCIGCLQIGSQRNGVALRSRTASVRKNSLSDYNSPRSIEGARLRKNTTTKPRTMRGSANVWNRAGTASVANRRTTGGYRVVSSNGFTLAWVTVSTGRSLRRPHGLTNREARAMARAFTTLARPKP